MQTMRKALPPLLKYMQLRMPAAGSHITCRCRKVWLTRIDYYYYHLRVRVAAVPGAAQMTAASGGGGDHDPEA
jgi:hypothetical protein